MNKTEAIEAIEEIKNIFCAANLFVKKEAVLPPVILDELCKVGEMATEIKKYVISENDKQVARLVDKLPRVVGLNIFAWYDLKKDIRMSLAICNRCLYEVVQMLADNNVKNNLPPGLPAILGKAMDVGFVDRLLDMIFHILLKNDIFIRNNAHIFQNGEISIFGSFDVT